MAPDRPPIDRDAARALLWLQPAEALYGALDQAMEWLDEGSLAKLLGTVIPIESLRQDRVAAAAPPAESEASSVDALTRDVEQFAAASRAGHYRREIPIRCRSCIDHPPATTAWLLAWERLYGRCLEFVNRSANADSIAAAVRGFVALRELFAEAAKDRIVAFSDEFGTWLLGCRPEKFPALLARAVAALPETARLGLGQRLRSITERDPALREALGTT